MAVNTVLPCESEDIPEKLITDARASSVNCTLSKNGYYKCTIQEPVRGQAYVARTTGFEQDFIRILTHEGVTGVLSNGNFSAQKTVGPLNNAKPGLQVQVFQYECRASGKTIKRNVLHIRSL